MSGQAVAGCSYTSTAQLFCDNTTIYHYGNPLGGVARDYSGFDEVRIDTTSEGTTSGLTGWGVYIDNIGYKFKNLVINTTGTAADGIHSKNAGGKLVADNIYITATGSSADGINIGRELQADYSIVEVNGDVTVDAENGMGLRANASANKDNAQSSIIIHGDTDIVTRGLVARIRDTGSMQVEIPRNLQVQQKAMRVLRLMAPHQSRRQGVVLMRYMWPVRG